MKVSFITTVLNEEQNIQILLSSLFSQTKRPDEVIIIDGGSKDKTVKVIRKFILNIRSEDFRKRFKVIIKKGNRSIGRNEAIRRAKGDIIAVSDSGCILDKNWTKNIIKPFINPKIDVVAGYYKGFPRSIFEKCLIPYVLVMPDKVNPHNFLPSSRSMALRKNIWEKAGGFPNMYSKNEDYVFAKKLKKINANVYFKRSSIVYWLPRRNIFEAFSMFFSFAIGDAQAGILRPKVLFLLARYILGLWVLIYSLYFSIFFMLQLIFYILVAYVLWSIWKNYKYVKEKLAILILPLIQFTADIAIICGTIFGFFKSLWDTRGKL
ncbi:MAG: glycosyltransferase [Patescibacteria group bacterium]